MFAANRMIPLGAVLAPSRAGIGDDELDLAQILQVGIPGNLLFLDGQEHSRLPLIRGKALLAGLSAVCHRDADREEQDGIGHRPRHQVPRMGRGADNRQSHAPPHEDLSQIVGVAGILPQPHADEGGGAVLAELVHLDVGNSLQGGRAHRQAEEEDAAHVGVQSFPKGKGRRPRHSQRSG